MHNLIKNSKSFSKTSGSLWRYRRDEPALNVAGNLDNVSDNSASFKFKQKITGHNGTMAVEIMVPLKYLINFWRNFELPLINCEINPILTWSANYVISNAAANQETTFAITNKKIYVLVVTLSTQNNAKLLQQLKSGFKRTINSNKYQSKTKTQNCKPIFKFIDTYNICFSI